HPDNRDVLERVAAALDLVEAGIDFLISDIRRSWKEVGGVVVEVNSFADMRPHWVGQPDRNVVESIICSLLPVGGAGRIPTGAVLNIAGICIGGEGVASRADLARIKAIVARRARRVLVLNAEDPLCLAMRDGARAECICLVAKDAGAPALRDHLAAGGYAVTL